VILTSKGAMMGRIGRTYPRFEQAQKSVEGQRVHLPAEDEGISAHQVIGAIVGILCALGLIGWLLIR
jgi:hypothetical protein